MPGDSGSSSSSTSSTTTNNTDRRLVVDGSSAGVSANSSTVNVTQTDHGAISSAMQILSAGQDRTGDSFDRVVGLADTLLRGSLSVVQDSTGVVSQAYETARNTQTGSIDQKTMIVLGIAGAVAVVAWSKK